MLDKSIITQCLAYLNGQHERLMCDFTENAQLFLPNCTPVTGKQAICDYFSELRARKSAVFGELTLSHFVQAQQQTALELKLALTLNHYDHLPIAILITHDNHIIETIRVYHSSWPLKQRHEERAALFSSTDKAELPKEILDYHEALFYADTIKATQLFAANGYIREPSGDIHQETLKHFFTQAFRDGGIHLIYHTIISQDQTIACEYTCTHWGGTDIPHQAGMEFWQLCPSTGKFLSVHIYDDIEQPTTSSD